MPFKKGGKPGPGRPRKHENTKQHELRDTLANAIQQLATAEDELTRGHPTIREAIAKGIIQTAIKTLAAARRRIT